MSDSVYVPEHYNLDLVDEMWTMDCLSDDDIDISPDIDVPMDDNDMDAQELARKEEEKWGDLGLDLFVNDTTQP